MRQVIEKLQEFNDPVHMFLSIAQKCLTEITQRSEKFHVRARLRLGCNIAPPLFKLYNEYVMRKILED